MRVWLFKLSSYTFIFPPSSFILVLAFALILNTGIE